MGLTVYRPRRIIRAMNFCFKHIAVAVLHRAHWPMQAIAVCQVNMT